MFSNDLRLQGNLLFFQNICDKWRIDARDCKVKFRIKEKGVERVITKRLDGLTIKGVDRDAYLAELRALDLPRRTPAPTSKVVTKPEEPKSKRLKLDNISLDPFSGADGF